MENRTVTSNPYGLKLKLSLYTQRRRLWWEEVQIILILDLGTRWGWVVSITPWPRFSSRERTPGTHWIGGWVGLRAGLDTEARGKILSPLPEIERRSTGRPARSQTLAYTDWATRLKSKWTSYVLSPSWSLVLLRDISTSAAHFPKIH
jgi:hypothetical protein